MQTKTSARPFPVYISWESKCPSNHVIQKDINGCFHRKVFSSWKVISESRKNIAEGVRLVFSRSAMTSRIKTN